MESFSVSTSRAVEFIDITGRVEALVRASAVKDGVGTIFVPHTTAGVTINENADPAVIKDILMLLDEVVPQSHSSYSHSEGNSAAHIKSSMMGHSANVLISNGQMQLGTWQSIFFCEFDGPRARKVWVDVGGK